MIYGFQGYVRPIIPTKKRKGKGAVGRGRGGEVGGDPNTEQVTEDQPNPNPIAINLSINHPISL